MLRSVHAFALRIFSRLSVSVLMAGASPRCDTGAIVWPCPLPRRPASEEVALASVLLPPGSAREEALEYADLPPRRQAEIANAASRSGFALVQAQSLRSQLLLSAAPYRFHGGESESKRRADAFERAVCAFVSAHTDVPFLREAGQRARTKARAAGGGGGGAGGGGGGADCTSGVPTPDLLFDGPVDINGHRVGWLEIKHFYALGARVDGSSNPLKAWLPAFKAPPQLTKYVAAFGPGAVVFRGGGSSDFPLPPEVLLLDSAAVEAAHPELMAACGDL